MQNIRDLIEERAGISVGDASPGVALRNRQFAYGEDMKRMYGDAPHSRPGLVETPPEELEKEDAVWLVRNRNYLSMYIEARQKK